MVEQIGAGVGHRIVLASEDSPHVGPAEIIPLEQERFVRDARESVRENVAEIQCRGVTAAAVAAPGAARFSDLLGIDLHDDGLDPVQQQIQLAASSLPLPRFNDDGRFEQCGG
jgi:hypothetical protein